MATVATRLASLTAAHMPWLRKGVDLTPPDGGQEICGPPLYRGRKKRANAKIQISKD
jgi:hypothetical protein